MGAYSNWYFGKIIYALRPFQKALVMEDKVYFLGEGPGLYQDRGPGPEYFMTKVKLIFNILFGDLTSENM
jgi:hypothetical protein